MNGSHLLDYALAALLIALVVLLCTNTNPLANFDFGTGLVKCGVDGLSTSCGSVTK